MGAMHTISEDHVIENHLDSGNRSCEHFERKEVNTSFCCHFYHNDMKEMLCFLNHDWRATKLPFQCNINFWKMYKFSLFGLLSHQIF